MTSISAPGTRDQALVSCATLANAILAFGLEDRWNDMPERATPQEWELLQEEGLIIRL